MTDGAEIVTLAPKPPEPKEINASYIRAIRVALEALNARLLLLLALLIAAGIWGWTVYNPDQSRTVAASLYTVGVFCPLVFLYLRKSGDN